jgi:hydrogenase maturation protease
MDLAHTVRDARGLVLVDAQRTGAPEGSVSIERGDAIAADGPDSGHAPGSPGELLAVARLMGWLPEQVALVGVEVGGLGVGTELTPVAAAALPGAVEMVCRELHLMDQRTAGFPVRDGAGALTGAAS